MSFSVEVGQHALGARREYIFRSFLLAALLRGRMTTLRILKARGPVQLLGEGAAQGGVVREVLDPDKARDTELAVILEEPIVLLGPSRARILAADEVRERIDEQEAKG